MTLFGYYALLRPDWSAIVHIPITFDFLAKVVYHGVIPASEVPKKISMITSK